MTLKCDDNLFTLLSDSDKRLGQADEFAEETYSFD